MRVANPIAPWRAQRERGDNLDVVATKIYDDNLAVATHVGLGVGDRQPVLHFLQESGLPVPHMRLKAAIDRDRQQKIHVHIARWPNGGVLAP
jgi:hypothetical protein